MARLHGVALLAAGALTVGIGAASAIYTVVNAVMLRPLPYAHGERFVAIFGGSDTDLKFNPRGLHVTTYRVIMRPSTSP